MAIVTDQAVAAVARELINLVKMCGSGEIGRDAAECALPPCTRRDDLVVSCFVALMKVVLGDVEARHIVGDGETESVTVKASKGVVAGELC